MISVVLKLLSSLFKLLAFEKVLSKSLKSFAYGDYSFQRFFSIHTSPLKDLNTVEQETP